MIKILHVSFVYVSCHHVHLSISDATALESSHWLLQCWSLWHRYCYDDQGQWNQCSFGETISLANIQTYLDKFINDTQLAVSCPAASA